MHAGVVMVFGTFDCLHAGHLDFFKQAKAFGSTLVVVVALDKNVEKFKGHAPRHTAEDRRAVVAELQIVDEALLGDDIDPMKRIREIDPEVICLGYDQDSYAHKLEQEFPDIKVKRLVPYKADIFKSSKLQ